MSDDQDDTQDQDDAGGQDDGAGRDAQPPKDDTEGLKSALGKERERAKAAETARKAAERSLREAQAKLDEIEGKDRPAIERLTAERDRIAAERDEATKAAEATTGRMRELAVANALTIAATKAGARYPDLLVDRLARRAEVDDDLAVRNADDLVKEAKAQYPELFRQAPGKADGGAGDDDRRGDDVKPGLGRMQYAYATESKTAKRAR